MREKGIVKKITSCVIVLIIFLIILLGLPIETFATQTYEYNGVTGTLEDNGVLTISGNGELNELLIRKFDNKKAIKSVIIEEGITSIGRSAFYECNSLINITIPSSATSIGDYAFWNCTSLENIAIPSSVRSIGDYAFYLCKSLKSAEISEGVRSIGDSAFWSCSSLQSIKIPNGVTNIESKAFQFCTSLKSIEIPSNVTNIGDNAFDGCIIYNYVESENTTQISIPNLIKRTMTEGDILYSSDSTYTNCEINESTNKLILDKDKVIKEGAKIEIGQGAFKGLTYYINYNYRDISKNEDGSVVARLSEEGNITISGIGEMKSSAKLIEFIPRGEIKNVIVEEGVTNIGDYIFTQCWHLITITLPSSVTSLGYFPFGYCTSLVEINVDEDNNNYASINGILFNKDKTGIIYYPAGKNESSYKIPSSVTSIGHHAFYECENLINIEIPSNVRIIGSESFSNCSSLQNIKIPEGVERILGYAFSSCSSLTNIEIPSSVTSIGNSAFSYCRSLTRITIPNSVTSIGNNAFDNCDDATIYCKSNSTAQSYAEENSIDYVIDDEEPKIEGAPENWAKSNVTITIEDEKCGLKEATIGEEEIEIGEDGKVTYTISAEGEWTIVAKDYLGNTSEKTIKIDKTAPTINVTGNLTERTADGVTLTVNATDNESGIPSQNAYSFDGGETWQTSNTKTYNENTAGIKIQVKDNAGNIGEYETINITNIKEISDIVEIKDYTLENNMVKYVQPKTKLSELENSVIIKDETKAKIVNKKGVELEETDIITTGSKIQIDAYNEQIEYIIVVAGDTTGDGKADMLDMISINKHRIKKKMLKNEYFAAGDVNKDGKLDMIDMIIVNKYRIGNRKTL